MTQNEIAYLVECVCVCTLYTVQPWNMKELYLCEQRINNNNKSNSNNLDATVITNAS